MIKTELRFIAVEPPRRPAQVSGVVYNNYETFVQTNIEAILKEVRSGDRPPLNHMCLPYTDFINSGTWMKAITGYIESAEEYMDEVDKQYEDNVRKSKPKQGDTEPLDKVQ